jgi:hypothetical protein
LIVNHDRQAQATSQNYAGCLAEMFARPVIPTHENLADVLDVMEVLGSV